MSGPTTLLPFQPATMSTAQLAAVSYLARYAGRTHALYAYQLRQWFAWCQTNGLDPLVGIQRAHVELYIRGLGERGLMDSSVNTMMTPCAGTSGSPTSMASSAPTRRCMHEVKPPPMSSIRSRKLSRFLKPRATLRWSSIRLLTASVAPLEARAVARYARNGSRRLRSVRPRRVI